ncbi:hypothetical protein [Streptomyces sp. UNOC14_S4]|nr:hypothetical protein [Streptomyces sp. UNOC14_S4]MCC3771514.1 hypothetical protein [Streptomyces sp. UNOC14_S4]
MSGVPFVAAVFAVAVFVVAVFVVAVFVAVVKGKRFPPGGGGNGVPEPMT